MIYSVDNIWLCFVTQPIFYERLLVRIAGEDSNYLKFIVF
jgi:hypothetical protein